MARKKGTVNYKNKVLIKIVDEILPNGEYGWQAVANTYQEDTKEETMAIIFCTKRMYLANHAPPTHLLAEETCTHLK